MSIELMGAINQPRTGGQHLVEILSCRIKMGLSIQTWRVAAFTDILEPPPNWASDVDTSD